MTHAGDSAIVHEEVLARLATQARRMPVPKLLIVVVLAGTAYGYLPTWALAAWVVAHVVLIVARVIVLDRLAAQKDVPTPRRLRTAMWMSVLSGVAFGSILLTFPVVPEFSRSAQSMVLVGMAAGAVPSTAGYRPVFAAFAAPVLGLLALMWFVTPTGPGEAWIGQALAFLILMLGKILLDLAHDSFESLRTAIEIRHQQVRTNAQLRDALAAAEAAGQARTRFIASASHDLRQPIHALSLFAGALAARPLDDRAREITRHMSAELKSLGFELDALLDLSKLDADLVTVNAEPFDIAEVLRRTHQTFVDTAALKGVALKVSCPPGVFVRCDPLLFTRVMRNLVENAVRYTDQGEVRLEVGVTVDGARVAVIDTGRGISEADRAHIFEEFYQVGNPERDRRQGLGLGLSIVKRLLELLHLELELESTPGVGSTFAVSLAIATEVGVGAMARSEPTVKGYHVLVIDDEAGVRLATREVLETLGCRVSVAESTEEALACAGESMPDIVLADFRLRGTDDGLRAVKALRTLRADLPALLVSGDTSPERLTQAAASGLRLLVKPLQPELLLKTMAESLAARTAMPANR